ncbi:MAG: apolipoprotein N-acyltransferase, partial [Myxococcota bacterium]
MKAFLPRLMLAIMSGAGMALVCPPVGLRHLLWIVFVPMLLSMTADNHRRNAWLGYAAGWSMLFVNFVWLADTVGTFSSLPYAVGLLVVGLFATIFGLPYLLVFGAARWLRQRLGMGWLVAFPALQIAHETLAPALFPYALGATLYRDPNIWQVASMLGASSLSGLALLTNAVIAEVVWRRQEGASVPWAPLGATAALVAVGFGFGAWRHGVVEATLSEAPVIRASILQHHETMEERLKESVWKSLSDWVLLTRKIHSEEPDLVVWPEGAVLFNPDDEREFRALGERSPKDFFGKMVERGGYDFLIGGGTIDIHEGTTDDGRQRYTAYNSSYAFDRTG